MENGRKVFAFPPIMGYGMSYLYVAEKFSEYELHSFDYVEEADATTKYVDYILKQNASEPIMLLAYSAGAELAIDVANALRETHQVGVVFLDGFYNDVSVHEIDTAVHNFSMQAVEFIGQSANDGVLVHAIEQKIRHFLEYLACKPKSKLAGNIPALYIHSDSITNAALDQWKQRLGNLIACSHIDGTHFELLRKSHAATCATAIENALSTLVISTKPN